MSRYVLSSNTRRFQAIVWWCGITWTMTPIDSFGSPTDATHSSSRPRVRCFVWTWHRPCCCCGEWICCLCSGEKKIECVGVGVFFFFRCVCFILFLLFRRGVCWLVGWLVCWLVGSFVRSFVCVFVCVSVWVWVFSNFSKGLFKSPVQLEKASYFWVEMGVCYKT